MTTLFSEYYDAFVSIRRGLFNTRDRAEHTRKRKTVSHTFSAKSVGQFEQYMHHNLELLQKQWDQRAATKNGGWYQMDALNWFNYLAFDVIGDLAFGAPFGMLEKGRDFAEVRKTPDAEPTFAPAIEVLNRRGEVSGYVWELMLTYNESRLTAPSAQSASSPKSNPTPNTSQTPSSATA